METFKVNGVSLTSARLAIAASIVVLALLAGLHLLSPEFDPAWRMVSEYANGQYVWVLSLLFISWGISSWALAYVLWFQVQTTGGRIGLWFLIAAGIGEGMAAVFDINHSLHGLSAMIGIPSLSIAAMLISTSLVRTPAWSGGRKLLLWTANLTWISIVLMAIAFGVMIATFTQSGAEMPANAEVVTTLPDGVIGQVGWANRFLIIVYCAWVMTAARQTLKSRV
ncbi:MAG: DUF998 domain-containing protein [Chloroflexi bacterium]|nr:MAG: DUF998 domain-containing protein [Chloroflexota bacterium]